MITLVHPGRVVGAGKHHSLYAGGPRRFEDIVCPDDVVREHAFPRGLVAGIGREVNHGVDALEGRQYGRKLGDIGHQGVEARYPRLVEP